MVYARWMAVLWGVLIALPVGAHDNRVSIQIDGGQRCVIANGLPDHETGHFPTRGNPHTIRRQDVRLCFPVNPIKGESPIFQRGSVGVALNGVQLRPGTADYYDPASPRGHSRDRRSGWNLEGIGARDKLGMDQNDAHVDERGLYHYHGIAWAKRATRNGSLVAYAADGFEIHYVGTTVRSSYRLKDGKRPTAPWGQYDGTYNEDWEFVPGVGTLDQCNGGMLDGKFVYFATDTYPFFPRCMWGRASPDFSQGRGDATRRAVGGPDGSPRAGRRGPPLEAIDVCRGKSEGASCTFNVPGRKLAGTCGPVRGGAIACKPHR